MSKGKQKYYKCMICGKDAVGCYSPDMDIKGLCFCEKHKDDVFIKYLEIINDAQKKL